MKNRLLAATGIVVIIIGAVFALQGFGVIGAAPCQTTTPLRS
jgi:hypothetical protein